MEKKTTIFAILLMTLTVGTSFGQDLGKEHPSDKGDSLRDLIEKKDEKKSIKELREELKRRELEEKLKKLNKKKNAAGDEYDDTENISDPYREGVITLKKLQQESAKWRKESAKWRKMTKMIVPVIILFAGLIPLIKGVSKWDESEGKKGKRSTALGIILTLLGACGVWYCSSGTS